MTQINISEQFQPDRYLIISRRDEEDNVVTTNVVVSDQTQGTIQIVNIEQGPVGEKGETGDQGPAGRDGATFDVLPIISGGTNNTSYVDDKIIYYDGTKLATSSYSIQDLLSQISTPTNAVTGVLPGTGLQATQGVDNSSVTLDVMLGDGLEKKPNNEIAVDSSIARISDLSFGNIQGTLAISRGGTNNTFYNQNKLLYYDGTKIASFPVPTGNILLDGVSIEVVAGSGLVGGGNISIPDGSVVLNIPSSSDILVTANHIELTTTGTAGTYSKVTTDNKGRVVAGASLTSSDILGILGYTPWHPGNDGAGSTLDADLLDGRHGEYYRDAVNLTGVLDPSLLPDAVSPGTYTKFTVDSNGLISDVLYANQQDIIDSLGYRPVPSSGSKTIAGTTTINGDVTLNGELTIYDHLPLLATDNPNILPDVPRGVSFVYGGLFSSKTGILAYYPAEDQLKLITNVFADGPDTDAGGNQDDLNGGNAESLFITQNLDGDESIVLLRHIADSLYVKLDGDETIRGLKLFSDQITFSKQIYINNPIGNTQPPLYISDNENKVISLNADLLDGEHGDYYTTADNITGAFSYENVTFDHIEGTNNYLPKFFDSVNDPANKIIDSIVYEDGNNNIVLDYGRSIIVGDANLNNSDQSISIGSSNNINGSNSLVVGTNNAVTGNNSVALNSNSYVDADNSVALGNFGRAYLSNQVSFGAFETKDIDNVPIEHAQHSLITMHMQGTKPGNSWRSLEPSISIPNNKSFAYKLDLLITKAYGTGIAEYRFDSGIFKNATQRSATNITEVVNITTLPLLPKKLEMFNNSQLKHHYYTFSHSNGERQLQDLEVTEPPLRYHSIRSENILDHYFYNHEYKYTSGNYYKLNDGYLVLDINKPIHSGSFQMSTSSSDIKILAKNHGMHVGSIVNLEFSNEIFNLVDRGYKVSFIENEDVFYAEMPSYSGRIAYYSGVDYDYAKIIVDHESIEYVDSLGDIENFSSGLFSSGSALSTNTQVIGNRFFALEQSNILYDENDYAGVRSIVLTGLILPKQYSYPSGVITKINPLLPANSGSVFFTHKKDVSGDFQISNTKFDKYRCFYTRKYSDYGKASELFIYHTGLNRPLELPYTPIEYSLIPGYKADDNDYFEIISYNDKYALAAKNPLNYEQKNVFYIRIKAVDRSNLNSFEKNFIITVNDKSSPYSFTNIPDQRVDVSENFDYTLPANLFYEEEYGGSISYTAQRQNGEPLPSWLSFDPNLLRFYGSPDGCDLGITNIRVIATNSLNTASAYRDFYLEVTDEQYQVFEYSNNDPTPITDIVLNKTDIDENLPEKSIVSELSHIGSYDPYLDFQSASNSFSGILRRNSDLVQCLPDIRHYSTTTISGNANLLPINAEIQGFGIPSDTVVTHIYSPFVMSGTPGLTDGKVYFTNGYDDYQNKVYAGQTIYASGHPTLPRSFTIRGGDDHSIYIDQRTVLTTELDYFENFFSEELNTEDGIDIVEHKSPFVPMWMTVEDIIPEPTGVTTEVEEDRLIITDEFSKNVIWSTGYPNCQESSLIENISVSYNYWPRTYDFEIDTTGEIDNINPSPQQELKRSNIKYGNESWSFSHNIENPILSIFGLGSGDLCNIKTEDDSVLDTEDTYELTSNNLNHHGTRVVFSRPFEIIDSYKCFRSDGKIMSDPFTNLISEDGNTHILHDYAINAFSGDVAILFPGQISYTKNIIAEYESDIDLSDTQYDFYYNWGKLIPFVWSNNNTYIRISNTYNGFNRTSLITHNAITPEAYNYKISGIKTQTVQIPSTTDCLTTDKDIVTGFESSESNGYRYYITGIVDVYSVKGTGTISLEFEKDINLDNRNNTILNLHTVASSKQSLDLPITTNYDEIDIINANTVEINNFFFMPDSGVTGYNNVGTFTINVDKNHEYIEEPNHIINRIPIRFNNVTTTLQGINTTTNLRPKNYTFDISSISGNRIFVRDDKNYFLKENNRPDYYNSNINGNYLTNGITFSGSLFNNHKNIYDVRYNLFRLNDTYDLIPFEYSYKNKLFSFVIDSGIIQPYDNLIVRFPSGYIYTSDDMYSLITEEMIQVNTGLIDLEPFKDSILLEKSQSVPPSELSEQIIFTGSMSFAERDTQGTCIVDNNLTNRLHSGLMINHNDSTIFGYEIDSIVSGFVFSGVIPRNNNVLSTNIAELLDSNHIGHASVFGTGNMVLYSGARLLREAHADEIGYNEFYMTDTNSQLETVINFPWGQQITTTDLTPDNISGIGTNDRPYIHKIKTNTSSDNTFIEFLYLGQNSNSFSIEGSYLGSGIGTSLKISHTTFEDQIDKYRRSLSTVDPIDDSTIIFEEESTIVSDTYRYYDTSGFVDGEEVIKLTTLNNTTGILQTVTKQNELNSNWQTTLSGTVLVPATPHSVFLDNRSIQIYSEKGEASPLDTNVATLPKKLYTYKRQSLDGADKFELSPLYNPRADQGVFINRPINRFDIIRIEVEATGLNNLAEFDFRIFLHEDITIKPYILESDSILNSSVDYFPYIDPDPDELIYTPVETLDYNGCIDCNTRDTQFIVSTNPDSALLRHDFHILPYIKTNNYYCGDEYSKNEQVFFNGNIIKIDKIELPKTYLIEHDEIRILSFNSTPISESGVTTHIQKFNPTNQELSISGISIEGERTIPPRDGNFYYDLLRENQYRHNKVFGVAHNEPLPKRGHINFIKSTSGQIDVLDYNNLFYHSYGGQTSHFPSDYTGQFVQPPQTGIYHIVKDFSVCESGTLCVIISGYNSPAFTGIEIGSNMYFDFDDNSPDLTNSYPVKDMLDYNVLSISPPYNQNYVGNSGLVYIIDAEENIKGHLNPNKDNVFVSLNGSVDGLDGYIEEIFDYYDYDSKRWKHTIHLSEQPPFTGYKIKLSNNDTNLYSVYDKNIKISGIEYSLDDGVTYVSLDDSILINDNIDTVSLRITTLAGDYPHGTGLIDIIPRMSMSGITSYYTNLSLQSEEYKWHGNGWNLLLKFDPPEEYYENKPIVLRTKDHNSFDDYRFSISQRKIPEINSFYPTGYVASGSMWHMGFDISKYNINSDLIENNLFIRLNNTPDPLNYTISYSDATSVVFTGDTRGAETGVYELELLVRDISTQPYYDLALFTGYLEIFENINSFPEYQLITNIDQNSFINLEENEQFKFSIPANLGTFPDEVLSHNIITNINTNNDYGLYVTSTAYNSQSRRFDVVLTPTGIDENYLTKSGRYVNQSINLSMKQPVYDGLGNVIYQTYTTNVGFNITFYKPVSFEPIYLSDQNEYDINEPWGMEFFIISGVGEHNPFSRPNANIFQAPNFGSYDSNFPEYKVEYDYDSEHKKWKVSFSSKLDSYDRYIKNTGIYPLSIYLEDEQTSFLDIPDRYSIKYNPIKTMANTQNNSYTTPNNSFYTNVDSLDIDESSLNDISVLLSQTESSVRLNNINLTRKYDRDLDLWQQSYISEPMTDKYDARMVVNGNQVTVQCKGLGDDKIIAVAKMEAIEISSTELQGIPLKITGIQDYSPGGAIDVQQGDKSWTLSFQTIGGLAHSNYPPTIILEGMPTFCTGFNPLIDVQLQCLTSEPEWNPFDRGGSWTYNFSGIPSCTLLGEIPFTITAIDTDPTDPENIYFGTDSVDFAYNYTEGNFAGNPPTISGNPDYDGMDVMKPLCDTQYIKELLFDPGQEALCIGPTGLQLIEVSGDVPSGLTWSMFYPGPNGQPAAPYSSLAGGYLRIQGYPTTFADGGQYEEILYLTVTDARGLIAEQQITFTDDSKANGPDAGVAVYFVDDKLAITPESGTKTIEGGKEGHRPPAMPESLQCRSILPHNECGVLDVAYSGTDLANDLRIFFDTDSGLSAGDIIYIGFESLQQNNDGVYEVHQDTDGIHITGNVSLNGTPPVEGNALAIKSETVNDIPKDNYDKLFEGNIIQSTSKCLLGGGRIDLEQNNGGSPSTSTKRTLLGMLMPSHVASLNGNQPFETNDTFLEKLNLTRINTHVDIISTTLWSDCWQTGALYLSGIVLPPIHAEIVDPPPAQDFDFSFNGSRFALGTRLAFGDTETQRLIGENQRSASLKYLIEDIFTQAEIQKGTVAAGSSFDTTTLISTSGTVYRLNILNEQGTFPTYDSSQLPGSENDYIWIHKASDIIAIPTQSTFSPIYPGVFEPISAINSNSDSINGVTIDPIYGIAIGGYVPSKAGIGEQEPYNIVGSSDWSSEDYLPSITGIIQENLLADNIQKINATYTASFDSADILRIQNAPLTIGDSISLEFYTLTNNGQTQTRNTIYTDNISITSSNFNGTDFTLEVDLGFSNINGYADIVFKGVIESIDTIENTIALKQNFNCSIGDSIGLDLNPFLSTELNLLEDNGYVTVEMIANNKIYLSGVNTTAWLNGFNQGDLVDVRKNINDNIKIMPYNISFINEGRYSFIITGNCNTREGEDLIYKIGTMENSNMPVFDNSTYPNVNMTPKKYFKDYVLHINKPISIVASSIQKVGNELSFEIDGGKRPVYEHTPDVQLSPGINTSNFGYCGFMRNTISGTIIVDEYDQNKDRLVVRLDLDSNYGIDWAQYLSVTIKVTDETGSDTQTYQWQ